MNKSGIDFRKIDALQDLYSGCVNPLDRDILSDMPLPSDMVEPFVSEEAEPLSVMNLTCASLTGWIAEAKKENALPAADICQFPAAGSRLPIASSKFPAAGSRLSVTGSMPGDNSEFHIQHWLGTGFLIAGTYTTVPDGTACIRPADPRGSDEG